MPELNTEVEKGDLLIRIRDDQLEQELDRQCSIKQSTSDKYQGSREEFENLLSLKEQEIQHLETL